MPRRFGSAYGSEPSAGARGDDRRDTGDDTRDTGGDTRDTGDDTRDTGDDTRDTGGDPGRGGAWDDTRDNTR